LRYSDLRILHEHRRGHPVAGQRGEADSADRRGYPL